MGARRTGLRGGLLVGLAVAGGSVVGGLTALTLMTPAALEFAAGSAAIGARLVLVGTGVGVAGGALVGLIAGISALMAGVATSGLQRRLRMVICAAVAATATAPLVASIFLEALYFPGDWGPTLAFVGTAAVGVGVLSISSLAIPRIDSQEKPVL